MDDRTAIRRLKRGDIEALGVLVRRYEVRAVRTAYLITQDRASAEDVVQTAFLRAYQHIDQFDESRPFAPWFLRSVANAAIQAAQRRQRELSLDAPLPGAAQDLDLAELLPDPAPGPDDVLEQADLCRAVWQALAQLSPEQRAAVVLRYFLSLSDDEISDELAIAPGTVRWRLHAARKQLRALLGRDKSLKHWQEG